MTTTYETLLTEQEGGVYIITLNRPEKLNAYNPAMQRDLIAAFQGVNQDDSIRAVIVTGAGRAFCSGADISGEAFAQWGSKDGKPGKRPAGQSITHSIYDCTKPIIAALNGVTVGVGITMCLPMDIRMMSTSARIGFLFNRRGMVMEAASSWFLPRLVGMQRAQEWVAAAEMINAEDALAGGLVRSIHAPEELLPAAKALARKFAEGTSPVTAALNRQLMWKMLGATNLDDALGVDFACVGYMGKSADAKEGVQAFFEKRPPAFPMKPSQDMPPFYPWWTDKAAE